MLKYIITFCLVIFALGGCATIKEHRQIAELETIEKNQEEIADYIKRSEKTFSHLWEAVKNNYLKKGLLKSKIVSEYGEPLYCERLDEEIEFCVYRDPAGYFYSDLIYLYFDDEEKLVFWEARPAP